MHTTTHASHTTHERVESGQRRVRYGLRHQRQGNGDAGHGVVHQVHPAVARHPRQYWQVADQQVVQPVAAGSLENHFPPGPVTCIYYWAPGRMCGCGLRGRVRYRPCDVRRWSSLIRVRRRSTCTYLLMAMNRNNKKKKCLKIITRQDAPYAKVYSTIISNAIAVSNARYTTKRMHAVRRVTYKQKN